MSKHTTNDIPYGYCGCGCGGKTPISPVTRNRIGHVKGQPVRYIHGHNGRGQGKPTPAAERFWSHVAVGGPDECWLWTGAIDDGYGHIKVDNRADGSQKPIAAHRFSWELHNGPVPDGLHVLHNCPGGDQRACCNPAHLWLGTNDDNIADKVAKGRQLRGVEHPMVKITEDDVREIRKLCAQKIAYSVIGAQFGIAVPTVWCIFHRHTWKHVK